jgi:AhpD family alkylhydroperoxidase
MKQRINPYAAAPDAMNAVMALANYVADCGLEHSLLSLVKIRASQINGCAFCVHMHTRDARAEGETEERIYLLSAWRESPLYSARERAALAWTEALTLIAQTHAPDDVYAEVAAQFDATEITKLNVAIGLINVWNRIAVANRALHPVHATHAA